MDDYEKAKYSGQLVRWQKLYESALHSDRIAAEIGVFVLKTMLFMNGAALAGLLTALVQLRENQKMVTAIVDSAEQFFWGLMAAALVEGI